MKAFADNKVDGPKRLKLALESSENIVGKGEDAAYQHFLLFPQCFQEAFFLLKVGIVWLRKPLVFRTVVLLFSDDVIAKTYPITRQQNFRWVQIETNSRRHFNSLPNDNILN